MTCLHLPIDFSRLASSEKPDVTFVVNPDIANPGTKTLQRTNMNAPIPVGYLSPQYFLSHFNFRD